MSRLIVIKSHSHLQGNTGVVIPLIIEEDNALPREVAYDEFENGNKLFIADDYQLKIDDVYKQEQLFVISSWTETDRDDWKLEKNKQRYISYGNLVRPLERSSYLPIIEMDMPDISSGIVNSIPFQNITNYHFMISKDGFISGPFNAEYNGSGWNVSPVLSSTPLTLPPHFIAQYMEDDLISNNLIVEVNMHGSKVKFLSSLERAKQVDSDLKDYISDTVLITLYSKQGFGKAQKSILSKTEANKLKSAIDTFKKNKSSIENHDRLSRLEELLDNYLSIDGFGIDIIENYLSNTTNGKDFLNDFIQKNKDILIKDKNKELDEKYIEHKNKIDFEINKINAELELKKKEIKLEIIKVAEQKENSEKEISDIKKKTAEQIKNESLKGQEELSEQVKNLELEKKELSSSIDILNTTFNDLTEKLGITDKIQHIAFTLDERQRQLDELNKKKYDIDRLVQQQITKLSSPDLSNIMLEHKTISQILSGQVSSFKQEIKPFNPKISSFSLSEDTRNDYINNLKDRFSSESGRHFHFDDIANITINIMQSFLTIFAGPPGTGKTSTAIRFANHMGLTNQSSDNDDRINRFINISVGKGWVSNRDLLGFWNGLKNTYQPSRSGLYEFIVSSTINDKSNHDDFLNLVLLDEANLSSIEHYWSDFLILCDTFNTQKNTINLGSQNSDSKYLNIPSSLRFIATINNDETTERLSPRLIDRAPIITLGHSPYYIPEEVLDNIENDGAISFSSLNKSFNSTESSLYFNDAEDGNFNSIKDILSSSNNTSTPIHVSPRKTIAIRKYCQIANEIKFQRYQPLDYAIAQHILPLINGYGKNFRDKLEQLNHKLIDCNYEISQQILSRIIAHGDDMMDSYSFF